MYILLIITRLYLMPPNSLNILTKLSLSPILYTYSDHENWIFPTFSPFPKIYNMVQWASNISIFYPFFGWTTFCFIPWLWGFNIFASNLSNNIYVISTFILHDFSPLLHVQIWLPTAWEFSNKKGLTCVALWYWSWNNTNQTNLHLFGTTLTVSPIYTLEFLIYPFWIF